MRLDSLIRAPSLGLPDCRYLGISHVIYTTHVIEPSKHVLPLFAILPHLGIRVQPAKRIVSGDWGLPDLFKDFDVTAS